MHVNFIWLSTGLHMFLITYYFKKKIKYIIQERKQKLEKWTELNYTGQVLYHFHLRSYSENNFIYYNLAPLLP